MIEWIAAEEQMPQETPVGDYLSASEWVLVCLESPVRGAYRFDVDRTLLGKWQKTSKYFTVTHWADITGPKKRKAKNNEE